MMNNKYKSFWDSMKKMNVRKSSLPEKIGDATGSSEILIQWRRHYDSLYNSVANSSDSVYHNTKVNHERFNDFKFSISQIAIAVNSLDVKKSPGIDGIFPDHLINCSVLTLTILCKLLNGFLSHGFYPANLCRLLCHQFLRKGEWYRISTHIVRLPLQTA